MIPGVKTAWHRPWLLSSLSIVQPVHSSGPVSNGRIPGPSDLNWSLGNLKGKIIILWNQWNYVYFHLPCIEYVLSKNLILVWFSFIIIFLKITLENVRSTGEKEVCRSLHLFSIFRQKASIHLGSGATTFAKVDVFVQSDPHLFSSIWLQIICWASIIYHTTHCLSISSISLIPWGFRMLRISHKNIPFKYARCASRSPS